MPACLAQKTWPAARGGCIVTTFILYGITAEAEVVWPDGITLLGAYDSIDKAKKTAQALVDESAGYLYFEIWVAENVMSAFSEVGRLLLTGQPPRKWGILWK